MTHRFLCLTAPCRGPCLKRGPPRHTGSLSAPLLKPPREAWAQWISPQTLLSQVRNTAPFLEPRLPAAEHGRLVELGRSPHGFLRILASWKNILQPRLAPEEQLQDYFALCLACHHSTVATFVPTDVDTKIRGVIVRESRDPEVLRPMLRLALDSREWTEDGISIRAVRGVSGHNGEQWSAIAGTLGRLLELGDTASAQEAQAAIETEIDREQAVFDAAAAEPGAELDLLRLSMTLAHNRGDLTQGMGFWKHTPAIERVMEHLSERGRFPLAVRVYQVTGLSAEEAQAAIEAEIDREQAVFDECAAERGAELDLLRLSMTLAHNRGDLTQGMGFWQRTALTAPVMEHLSERGRFSLAVQVYQFTGLSAEGHRHYPLRPVKVLRRSPATLLPLCPFLDEWGGVVAQLDESHEVLAALVGGCHKVHGQQGYYLSLIHI